MLIILNKIFPVNSWISLKNVQILDCDKRLIQ